MSALTLDEAMRRACDAVKVSYPKARCSPGHWTRTDSLGKNGKNDAAVKIDDDGNGGVAINYQTGLNQRFSLDGANDNAPKADPKVEAERKARDAEVEAERKQALAVCRSIVSSARTDTHPYLTAKGFPDERGLICDDPSEHFPRGDYGERLAYSLADMTGPFLIVPGRVEKRLVTVQFIDVAGTKKNILRGSMSGAFHRIASGRDTWVCEGIATAMTVRAALRLLGQSVTVLSAFSASNVAKVAEAIPGARVAADHDRIPKDDPFDGVGAGEFYARRSRRHWTMPTAEGEDFNDWHQREGLRAVALHLREAMG